MPGRLAGKWSAPAPGVFPKTFVFFVCFVLNALGSPGRALASFVPPAGPGSRRPRGRPRGPRPSARAVTCAPWRVAAVIGPQCRSASARCRRDRRAHGAGQHFLQIVGGNRPMLTLAGTADKATYFLHEDHRVVTAPPRRSSRRSSACPSTRSSFWRSCRGAACVSSTFSAPRDWQAPGGDDDRRTGVSRAPDGAVGDRRGNRRPAHRPVRAQGQSVSDVAPSGRDTSRRARVVDQHRATIRSIINTDLARPCSLRRRRPPQRRQ